jgi:hypothetical protein
MSSHHFVKEGQEPALFVLEKSSIHLATPLLEWVPLVMVADDVLEDVLQWGIKIDVVLQAQLPLSVVEQLVVDQQPVEILSAEPGQVVSTGLQFFIDEGYEAVNVIGSSDDHVFQSIEQVASRLQVAIFTSDVKWSLITSGVFEKWMPADYSFQIRSGGNFQTEGITQNGSSWRTVSERMVSIKAETPFWVGELH